MGICSALIRLHGFDSIHSIFMQYVKNRLRMSSSLFMVLGDTPGLSVAAQSTEHLIQEYCSSRIFLNTSLISPVPTCLLEAMACGCAIVTTSTCMIPEIIKNGENGYISNDPIKLREYVERLLSDEKLATKLGLAARETIINNFSLDNFVNKWNEVFVQCVKPK